MRKMSLGRVWITRGKMDLRTLVLVVYVLQIAFICDGNQENHTIPDHHDQNGYTTYDEQEKKLIGVLEEALLQLKERKLQIGKLIDWIFLLRSTSLKAAID